MNSRKLILTLTALTAMTPVALHANPPPAVNNPVAATDGAAATPTQTLTIVKNEGTTIDAQGLAVHDFGTISVARTEPIQYDFAIRNDSSSAVTLDHVQAACSCTAAVVDGILSGEDIAAGKTITIHVSVDPGHLGPGPANKMVWVYLKGQPAPAATLQMIGTLTPLLTFTPSLLDFGAVDAGHEKSLLLQVSGDAKLLAALTAPAITPAIADLTFVRDKDMHTDKDGNSTVDYHVVLGKHARIGQMQGTVSFTTSPAENSRAASAYASLVGEVRGEIVASPATVAFGSVASGKRTEQQIMISGAKKVLAGSSARSTNPYVSAKIVLTAPAGALTGAPAPKTAGLQEKSGEKTDATLEVTLSAKAPSGVLQTEIVVTTPDGQQLALPVWAFVEAGASP